MKWIFALIGYFLKGFWGGVLGFIIGIFFDNNNENRRKQTWQRAWRNQPNYANPMDVELSLLSLCAIVIKADGHSSAEELSFVRQNFVRWYGQEKSNYLFQKFNQIKHQEISLESLCQKINRASSFEMRLQIVHFLFSIAQCDGHISPEEISQIEKIAVNLHIPPANFKSIQAMFVKSTDDAYQILNIPKTATDSQVKKAYREMVKKYHPDKVITDDPALKKGAEEKFRKVQEAYEKIAKERGM